MYSVVPSGCARAASAAAILPLAPGLFSTTKVVLSDVLNSSAMIRAKASVDPPAEKPTSMRTGLSGLNAGAACAQDNGMQPATAVATPKLRRIRRDLFIQLSPCKNTNSLLFGLFTLYL